MLLLERRQIWLTVTDVTLQTQDENNSGLPKTVPVCVTASCVLGQEVLDVLAEAAAHSFFFRDALRDSGILFLDSFDPVATDGCIKMALWLLDISVLL